MDDRLRMNRHGDLRRGDVKQPAGFDHLQSLIHHGGGIDRDFRAHLPRWMGQRLGGRHGIELFERPGSKRTTTGRENDPLQVRPASAGQGLKHGAMLAVDRDDLRSRFSSPVPSRGDRPRPAFPCSRRPPASPPRRPPKSHAAPPPPQSRKRQPRPPAAWPPGSPLPARRPPRFRAGTRPGDPRFERGISNRREGRPELPALRRHLFPPAAGGQRDDLHRVGMSPDNVAAAGSDRSGRSEDGNPFHAQTVRKPSAGRNRRPRQRLGILRPSRENQESGRIS